ncbi:MAG: LicD family protein [Oscillospiraceae bacterium]|nr:LicD family protein [Oscillospiraceae bacterium]
MRQLELSEIMKIETEILQHFDQLCQKYHLRYSIAYGTMIGCIRHKGFIPWDDDIDVIMPRKDYEKLLKLQYKSGNYEIRSYRYTKGYYYPFAKMIDASTLIHEPNRCETDMGLFIDIFPLDYVPENVDFAKLEKDTEAHNRNLLLLGVSKENAIQKSALSRFKRKEFYYLVKPFRKFLLEKGESKYFNLRPSESGLIMNQFFVVRRGKCYRMTDFDSLLRLPFENIEVSVLKNYDEMLRGIYGDYMQLPPVEQRVNPHQLKAWKK